MSKSSSAAAKAPAPAAGALSSDPIEYFARLLASGLQQMSAMGGNLGVGNICDCDPCTVQRNGVVSSQGFKVREVDKMSDGTVVAMPPCLVDFESSAGKRLGEESVQLMAQRLLRQTFVARMPKGRTWGGTFMACTNTSKVYSFNPSGVADSACDERLLPVFVEMPIATPPPEVCPGTRTPWLVVWVPWASRSYLTPPAASNLVRKFNDESFTPLQLCIDCDDKGKIAFLPYTCDIIRYSLNNPLAAPCVYHDAAWRRREMLMSISVEGVVSLLTNTLSLAARMASPPGGLLRTRAPLTLGELVTLLSMHDAATWSWLRELLLRGHADDGEAWRHLLADATLLGLPPPPTLSSGAGHDGPAAASSAPAGAARADAASVVAADALALLCCYCLSLAMLHHTGTTCASSGAGHAHHSLRSLPLFSRQLSDALGEGGAASAAAATGPRSAGGAKAAPSAPSNPCDQLLTAAFRAVQAALRGMVAALAAAVPEGAAAPDGPAAAPSAGSADAAGEAGVAFMLGLAALCCDESSDDGTDTVTPPTQPRKPPAPGAAAAAAGIRSGAGGRSAAASASAGAGAAPAPLGSACVGTQVATIRPLTRYPAPACSQRHGAGGWSHQRFEDVHCSLNLAAPTQWKAPGRSAAVLAAALSVQQALLLLVERWRPCCGEQRRSVEEALPEGFEASGHLARPIAEQIVRSTSRLLLPFSRRASALFCRLWPSFPSLYVDPAICNRGPGAAADHADAGAALPSPAASRGGPDAAGAAAGGTGGWARSGSGHGGRGHGAAHATPAAAPPVPRLGGGAGAHVARMLDAGSAGAADTGRKSLDGRASVGSGGSVGSEDGEGEEGGPEAEYDSAGAADGSGDSPSTVEDAELEEAEASLRAAEELLTAGDLWERAQAGKAEVSAVASQIDALLLSHNEALNEWHQMQQAVDRARDEHRKACGRLGDVEGRSAAAAARTAELEASVKRTDAALARLREVAKEAKALKSRLSGAEGERSKLCSEKDRDSKALQVAKGTVGSLEASKRALEGELATVRQELLLAEEEAAGSAPAWRTEAETVRAQLKAAQESERSCAALAASAEKALAPLRQEAARLRRERDAAEATHASAVAAAAQAASDASALEAQVAREAAEWQAFVTTESASLRELQRACAGAVEEMSILQSVNSAMSEQVAVFRELNVRLAEGRDAALAGLPMHVGGGMRHSM